MINQFNYNMNNLYTPIIFREDFNENATINFSQAWSLFFSGGQEENILENKSYIAQFCNYILFAIIAFGSLSAINYI